MISLEGKIKNINSLGVVNVIFTQAILVPSNISIIDKKVLDIKVIPGPESNPAQLGIVSWKLSSKIFQNNYF